MIQENALNVLSSEQRVQEMERQVAQRLGNIDEGLQQAMGQVREGDFVRRILKAEIQKIVSEQKAEEERKAEEARMDQIQELRFVRRKRLSLLLAGVVFITGSAVGWKTYFHPQKSLSEAFGATSKDVKDFLAETIAPKEVPPEAGQIKIWVTPEEEASIQTQREKWQKLQDLTEEFTQSQLQYQGWQAKSNEDPLREASLEYWERRTQDLEAEIRTLWLEIHEGKLQPAPTSQPPESTALNDSK